MNFCFGFINIPDKIKEALNKAPLFFGEAFEKNVNYRGQQMFYAWDDERIFCARVRKQLFFKVAILDCEPFLYGEGKNIEEKEFLNQVVSILKQQKIQWVITTNTARFQSYPKEAKTIKSGNHIIDLANSYEQLWANMHSKHRNSVKRGEKAGMELITGGLELIEEYTPLANETYARSGEKASSSSYYKSIIEGIEEQSFIMLLKKDGVLQAGGMFLYNQNTAYYLHGASIARPEPGSTNYLLWKAIENVKEKGTKEFSFVGYHVNAEEGSKLDGIQKFKERFGGALEYCYSFKCVLNPFVYKLFCLIMRIKSGKIFRKYKDHIDEQIKSFPELN